VSGRQDEEEGGEGRGRGVITLSLPKFPKTDEKIYQFNLSVDDIAYYEKQSEFMSTYCHYYNNHHHHHHQDQMFRQTTSFIVFRMS